MKTRRSFVSNSSSSSFIITNFTNEIKTITDFVEENPQLVEKFVRQYKWYQGCQEYTQEGLLKCAATDRRLIKPGRNLLVFADDDGTSLGTTFDYILRDGGHSKSFNWYMKECRGRIYED